MKCRDYCEKMGWNVVAEFKDDGYSGTTLIVERPEGRQLFERIKAGDFDVVITSDDQRRGLDLVLWDLAQNQYIAQSSLLAESVQRHMNELTGIRDRGVRQAPFRVLMGATMPAILVEVGFISNLDEEAQLRTLGYRSRVAQAMATAVYDFLSDLERLSGPDFSSGRGAGQR